MGCSLRAEEKQERDITLEIDRQIKEDGKKLRDEVKMLLLGIHLFSKIFKHSRFIHHFKRITP
jgi:hypothetical protein